MKPVLQSITEPGKGDCFAACIASLLGLPLAAVPNFCGDHADRWWDATQEWLAGRGLFGLEFDVPADRPFMQPIPPVPFVAVGKSPRGEYDHAVIVRVEGGEVVCVHDPHPDGTFLDGDARSLFFLVPLEVT